MAGLYDDEAVWPFTDGSVSAISKVTVRGSSMAIGTPSCTERITERPSVSHGAFSPTVSSDTTTWS